MVSTLRPPRTVYHGTDTAFEEFDTSCSLGAHFGSQQAARDRLRDIGRLRIEYLSYANDDKWMVREQNWTNRPCFEHGPFDDEAAADAFCAQAPQYRTPLPFEIDVYRPLELPDLGTWTFEGVMHHLVQSHLIDAEREDIYSAWNRSTPAGWAALKAALVEQGYDCVVYKNETEDRGSLSWIVFDAAKIFPKWTPEKEAAEAEPSRPYDVCR